MEGARRGEGSGQGEGCCVEPGLVAHETPEEGTCGHSVGSTTGREGSEKRLEPGAPTPTPCNLRSSPLPGTKLLR